MSLDDITKDGFILDKNDIGLAFLSLGVGMKAYFSTYKYSRYFLSLLQNDKSKFPKSFTEDKIKEQIKKHHHIKYYELYSEIIIRFQHYTELMCKEILRDSHPLLADDASKKPELLYKLLLNKKVDEADEREIKSLTFSESLNRLSVLINKELITDHDELRFIIEHKKTIEKLNLLRNRVIHRGVYVLNYVALDKFIGEYIFPFIKDSLLYSKNNGYDSYWKYKKIYCGIDPIEEIIKSFSNGYDIGKIALLKELARASYESPIENHLNKNKATGFYIHKDTSIYEKRAKLIASIPEVHISCCPVCGMKSLVSSEEHDSYEKEDEIHNLSYITEVKCECCGFQLFNSEIKNASHYGYTEIDDFWEESYHKISMQDIF